MYREVRITDSAPTVNDFGGEWPPILIHRPTGGVWTLKTGDVLVQASGYALQASAANAATFTDAQTIYFGLSQQAPSTTAAVQRLYVPRAGIITAAFVYGSFLTTGTNEAWAASIRVNNTTDTLIQSLASNSADRVWSNTALSVAVARGDYIEIKLVNPTWATNPADGRLSAVVYIT